MSRVSFDLALRNAIRGRSATDGHGAIAGTDRPDEPATKPRRGAKAWLRKQCRSIAKRLNHPFGRRRDPTSENLMHAIGELKAFVDVRTGNAHLKLDRLIAISDQQQIAADDFRRMIARLDGEMVGLFARIATLHQAVKETGDEAVAAKMSIESFQARSGQKTDDVQIKLSALIQGLNNTQFRSWVPIEVDAATLAMRVADGFVMVPKSDVLLLLALHGAGAHGLEPGTRQTIGRILGKGMRYIDVGAHIGLLTLAGARAVGETGTVLAIEPTPETFEHLTRTVAANALGGSVNMLRVAAGSHTGRRKLHVGTVLGHNSFYRPAEHAFDRLASEIEVDVARLDDLVPSGTPIDLVKIDAEGAELEILAGMSRIIAESPSLAIIAEFGPSHLERAGTTPQEWLSAFGDHGFEAWAIDERSSELSRTAAVELAAVQSVNLLLIRPGSDPARRLGL